MCKLDDNKDDFNHKYITSDKQKKIINLRTQLKLKRQEVANICCVKEK
jgi:hypothetical protein